MRIDNYQGVINDRPIDAVVVDQDEVRENANLRLSHNQLGFSNTYNPTYLDRILAAYNQMNQPIPVADLPKYKLG